MKLFSKSDDTRLSEVSVTDVRQSTELPKRRGSMLKNTHVNELTLDGKLGKSGLANYEGQVYYQFSENSPYLPCRASLCGPVLQIEPMKKLNAFVHGSFEVDLTTYVEVGLEHIPLDPIESSLKFPLWLIVLNVSAATEAADERRSISKLPKSASAPLIKAVRKKIVLGIHRQDDAVVWARELKRSIRDVENAINMQKNVTAKTLGEVVDMQLSTSGSSGGIHSLQNVTQVQRNVAILGMKGKHKTHRASTNSADILLSSVNMIAGPGFFGHRPEDEYEDLSGKEVVDQVEYNRKHFIVKSRGSYYLFWGRLRIRLTFVVRMVAILISYPFVVIYSVLDMETIVSEVNRGLRKVEVLGIDISFLFKNARRFVVTANLTLLFMPIFLVFIAMRFSYQAAQDRYSDYRIDDAHARSVNGAMQTVLIFVVASYSAVFFVPIAIAIGRKNKATSDLTDVVDGTFCFRPHYKMRLFAKQPLTCNLNTANLSTLGGVFIEFILHSFYCLPKCQLKDCSGLDEYRLPKQNMLERYMHIKWRVVFWILFAFTIFNAMVFVLHGVLSGKKKFHLSNHFWLWQFVWVLNGPAFVSIVMTMFQTFGCALVDLKPDDGITEYEFVLLEDTSVICFSTEHKNMCVAAFVGLAIYLTQAALLPSGTYKETMRNKLFDILYVPAYLEGHFFLKALFAATYVLTFRLPDPIRITLLLFVNLSLLLLNMRENPCAIVEINILRTATLSGTVWAGAASLLFVTQLASDDQDKDCSSNNKFLPLLFLTGWVMIFSGALYIGRSNSKPIDSVLAHTFLELDRQVNEAKKNAKSGPLLGLDGRPMTINGVEVQAHEALSDWGASCSRLKAESSRLAIRAEAEKARYGSDAADGGRWHLVSSVRGRTASGKDKAEGTSAWRRRMSMVFGQGNEAKETLSDDDLALIHQLNNKSKLGSVAPRVLEPLISLTLSDDPMELLYAAKYIRELVWCTTISYPRVQFQALWALANLAQKRTINFEGNEELREMAKEQGVVLEPGQDLGDKFREMIVSTNYITRSADDDVDDMMEKTALDTGIDLTMDETPEPSNLKRRMSRIEHMERDLGGFGRTTTNGLLSDDHDDAHPTRLRSSSKLDFSADMSRGRSTSKADLTNAGYNKHSAGNSIRASLVHHAMSDVVRRLSVSGPQHGLIDGISHDGSRNNSEDRYNSRDRASTADIRNHLCDDRESVDLVRDTVDMTYELEKEEPTLSRKSSSTAKLFAVMGDDDEEAVSALEEHDDEEKPPLPSKQSESARPAPLTRAVQLGEEDEEPIDDLYAEETQTEGTIVDENNLGGLHLIYSGFREMNETVKMEALGVMVNLCLNPQVADSLVFHQQGDTLAHILELIWAPGVFTKFATLVLVNLATTDKRRRVILRNGGLAAVIGLLLGSDYDLQVAACHALVNLALSPAHHVPLLASTVFIERLLAKLAPVDHPETQMLVASLIRNMCVRVEFARALNNPEHKTFERLKKLRDSSTKDKNKSSEQAEAVSKLIMFTVNSLSEFKQREVTAAAFMKKLPQEPALTAEVTWDTWNSKLDRMWNPVLSISPVARGRHIHVPTSPHHEDIQLSAEDTHGNELKFRIVTKPLCGTLVKPDGEEKSSCVFRYTPFAGYSGTDYFTFIASNSVMDSNLGTMSIKVDASLAELRQKEEEARLEAEAKIEEAKKATLDAILSQNKIIVPPKKTERPSESKKLGSILSFVREVGDEEDGEMDDLVKRRTGELATVSDSDESVDRESVRDVTNSNSVCLPGLEEDDVRVTVDLGLSMGDMDLDDEPPKSPTASESWSAFSQKNDTFTNESKPPPNAAVNKVMALPSSGEFEV
mmetsp:Transcript_11685/g.14102  ORF Transcript_11685/g.14102 Transcript_11685/m.14102 type:complete len:1838 (-) Transcript_11685:84-5597(-)